MINAREGLSSQGVYMINAHVGFHWNPPGFPWGVYMITGPSISQVGKEGSRPGSMKYSPNSWKSTWGDLSAVWVPNDTRDAIVDFVRHWAEKTGIATLNLVYWLKLSPDKFYDWKKRYGKVNLHNGWIPRPGRGKRFFVSTAKMEQRDTVGSPS